MLDADLLYRAWLAALARSNRSVALEHARVLLQVLEHGQAPIWTSSAEGSFLAWCIAEGLFVLKGTR